MERVVITRKMALEAGAFGLAMMQVCAEKDATDEEILEVCNRENPSGTTNGWSDVVRTVDESNPFRTANKMPIVCDDDPERLHFVVLC